jgi:DNA-binding transcriptional regulator GbsR (MarR family)
MPNIENHRLTDAERRFIDDMSRLLTPWGVPQTAARLYGYLLLCPAPVSLDQISADLQVSKSSASVAARLLEMFTMARRHGQRGSRRVLYEASDNYEGMLNAQNRMLQEGAALLKRGSRTVATGPVRDRLEEMADFYLVTLEAMEAVLRQWHERKTIA